MISRLLRRTFCNNLIRQGAEDYGLFRTRANVVKDRFDLHTLTSIQYMCHLVRTNKYKLTHEQNITLFYRLSQVFDILGKSIYYYDEFGVLSDRILAMFRNPQDLASLGTFAIGLVRVGMFKQQVWAYICDFIDQRKYAEEHDEIYGLITAFKHTRQKFPGTWIEYKTVQIYRQLFSITLLHMKQRRYNLKQMRSIVHCFHKYGVNEDYVWEEVQYFLKTKLREIQSKPLTHHVVVYEAQLEKCLYESKIVVNPILQELSQIAYVLAFNRMPALQFIQFSQKLVNFFQKNEEALKKQFERALQAHNLRIIQKFKKRTGSPAEYEKDHGLVYMNPIYLADQNIIYFLFVLKRTLDTFKEYTVDRELYEWAINLVFQQYNRYTISQIILLNRISDFLEKTEQQMQAFTLNKIKIVRQKTVKMNDLKSLFTILGLENIERLEDLLIHFLDTSHPSEIYQFTKFCQEYKAYIPRYFVELPRLVNHHHKYFSFDENCYFYYILLTNQVYWQGCPLNSYDGQMQILKQTIKTSAFSRGFKIKMDSYFHKLLDHINLADFFEGGGL